jgi:segregation and condensation protein B
MDDLKAKLEALIFIADEPVTRDRLLQLFTESDGVEIEEALEALRRDCENADRGISLREVAGGFQFFTRPEYDELIRAYLNVRRRSQLSAQALETLAIVAYEQPISTPEIREMRGSEPGHVLRTLLERKLIRIVGRKDVVGRPFVWGTTQQFLLHFGLSSLDDLPKPNEFVGLLDEQRGSAENEAKEKEHPGEQWLSAPE